MERIASLLPSATELAWALGFSDALVGRSHECDYPPGVGSLPVLTEPKLDPEAASRVIDDRVKRLVRDGLSVYFLSVRDGTDGPDGFKKVADGASPAESPRAAQHLSRPALFNRS